MPGSTRNRTRDVLTAVAGATILAGAVYCAYRILSPRAPTNTPKRPSSRPRRPMSSESAAPAAAAAAAPPAEAGDKSVSTAETVAVLKVNKSTGIKSSYYHFSSTPAEEAARYAPQLISDPSKPIDTSPMPTLLSTGSSAPASGASRWNAAGTWEDKDISEWAHALFKDTLTGFSVPSVGGQITGFDRVSGDCTIIFTRGRKRHGYDVEALANFSATVGDATIKGTLEFPEIADSSTDEPWQVLVSIKDPSADTRAQADQVYDAFKAAIPDIRKKIDAWVEELKKHD